MLTESLRRRLQSLKAGLRQRHLRTANIAYYGHIDGLNGDLLYGWAIRAGAPGPLRVGLFVPEGLLLTTISGKERSDVRDAGFGDGKCGFSFPITGEVRRAIQQAGGKITILALVEDEPQIASFQLPETFLNPKGARPSELPQVPPALPDPVLEKCRSRLFGDLKIMGAILANIPADTQQTTVTQKPMHLHQKMFAVPKSVGDTPTHLKLPDYVEYTKFRYRLDRQFDTDNIPEDSEHFLNWYLCGYNILRQGRRVPLSRALISHLNTPIVMGGQPYTLPRFMWWRIAQSPGHLGAMNLSNPDWFGEISYWWAWNEARALYLEDCLVTQDQIEMLRFLDEDQENLDWPLTRFMHHFYRDNPQFYFLDRTQTRDRELLTLSLIAMAATRPDVLRFLPEGTLERAFAQKGRAPSPFEAFFTALTGSETSAAAQPITLSKFKAAMRLLGYDLNNQVFLSITPEGDRFDAAATPPLASTEKVDVQMIGPFKKASGLGQATRLSAQAMALTGFSVNTVDHGLDNPAPEGFSSSAGQISDYRPARVNLIHLNAESIPLVFAYEPDVFNGAYNIGYFFWELDSPAACHFLGIDFLDEIWVSSEYGVTIYQPGNDKPVTKVGMCFEETPDIDRVQAQAFVNSRFGFSGSEFVFLVAFDSYSFVQRKNPIGVLKAFLQAFDGVHDARLVIKTQNRDKVTDPVQVAIWDQVDALMAGDKRIRVLNETLTYKDLLQLKKGSDCYISLHKSEGWGFGMIEAMNLSIPVVCTGYSGNMEFCSEDTAWLVKYTEVTLEEDDYIFVVAGQKWADPDIDDAARQFKAVYDDPKERARKVAAAYKNVQQNFSPRAIAQNYQDRLKKILDACS